MRREPIKDPLRPLPPKHEHLYSRVQFLTTWWWHCWYFFDIFSPKIGPLHLVGVQLGNKHNIRHNNGLFRYEILGNSSPLGDDKSAEITRILPECRAAVIFSREEDISKWWWPGAIGSKDKILYLDLTVNYFDGKTSRCVSQANHNSDLMVKKLICL